MVEQTEKTHYDQGSLAFTYCKRSRLRNRILKPVNGYWMRESIGRSSEQILQDLLQHPYPGITDKFEDSFHAKKLQEIPAGSALLRLP